jgi:hypothetical protein
LISSHKGAEKHNLYGDLASIGERNEKNDNKVL